MVVAQAPTPDTLRPAALVQVAASGGGVQTKKGVVGPTHIPGFAVNGGRPTPAKRSQEAGPPWAAERVQAAGADRGGRGARGSSAD